MARRRNTPITASVSSGAAFVFTASISGGAGNGINGMLRKKFYVVRKKYHVVRKLFYVASIFGGAAGRRNRPPWELSSTASRRRQRLQCVYRAHTSLPDTNNWQTTVTFLIPLPSHTLFFSRQCFSLPQFVKVCIIPQKDVRMRKNELFTDWASKGWSMSQLRGLLWRAFINAAHPQRQGVALRMRCG